jgi:hypothetical protein
VLGKAVKRGKSPDPANWTREREYIFGPGEVRKYTVPITDLLSRDFHLGAAKSEVVHISVMLVILTFEGEVYHTRNVDSNTIDVNVL